MAVELSIIVATYQMQREAPRTIRALLPPSQQHAEEIDYEIIVIDNGSQDPLRLPFADQSAKPIKLIRIEPGNAKRSPVSSVNTVVKEFARGRNVMICIDGARLPSSHLVCRSVDVLRRMPHAFAFATSRHLGTKNQALSVAEGYDQDAEDRLLATVNWENDLDLLYEISVWAGAHDPRNFLRQNESNAVTMSQESWAQLGGFKEGFERAGGGLANLDLFSRAVSRPDAFNVLLHGEATFHQVHGGAATSHVGYFDNSLEEYKSVVGAVYRGPQYHFWADLGADYGRMDAVSRFLHG